MKTNYLRRLYVTEITLVDPTDGTQMIKKANDVFDGFVDLDGFNIPTESPLATPSMVVDVHELVEDGTLDEILGSLSERNRWQESQVVAFCRKHRDKLRAFGLGTFFETEGGVLYAYLLGEKLNVVIYNDYDDTWSAKSKPRFMILKKPLGGVGASPLTNKPHIIVYGCFSF